MKGKINMSGHSKWSTIKHKKAATDAVKGKVFGQLSRQIRIATKEGGSGDPQFNAALRAVLEKARAENLPKDKIQRAIDAGLGKGGAGQVQEIVYEAFGPGGISFLVLVATDNTNRTTSEVKSIFHKFQGSLGSPGSAAYMFARNQEGGYISTMPAMVNDLQQQKALQNLLDELRENEDVEEVFCSGEWPGKE
ncbi:MAG TPA: YebC/PmpR family DNA-binding transcriptional regulator [Patescibacteria group bacterium]